MLSLRHTMQFFQLTDLIQLYHYQLVFQTTVYQFLLVFRLLKEICDQEYNTTKMITEPL